MDKRGELKRLSSEINNCRRCQLFENATQAVAGEGNQKARVFFLGEAPGKNEDLLGRPFVGRAGKFLDELLRSINLPRKKVFITGAVKHRPPKNRMPRRSEILACRPWLDKQLEIINPKIIVCLGKVGLAKFFPKATISKIHGRGFLNSGKIVFATYHPAAGLRSTRVRKILFEDFKKLKKLLTKN